MKPENVKDLFRAYAQSREDGQMMRQLQGAMAYSLPFVEMDNPCGNPFIDEMISGQMWESQGATAYSLPFGQAPISNTNVIRTGRRLAEFAKHFATQPEKSIIRFKEIWMVKEPVEQNIHICVLRDPSFSHKETIVDWKTTDKTALSGTHYTGSSGKIIFNQGDTSKEIEIPILNFNDEADDLRFIVELNYGVYNPNPITISLTKTENFYSDEKNVHDNLSSLPFGLTVPDVKAVLDDGLSTRTFRLALTYLCSTTKDIDHQIALACELSFLSIKKSSGKAMPEDSIINILSSFFRRDEYNF